MEVLKVDSSAEMLELLWAQVSMWMIKPWDSWWKTKWYTEESDLQAWLLLLSRFSRVRLSATPQTEAHQAPLSLGFSRQEHWSGLPFPPPMHESEKWKWSRSVVSDSLRPRGLQPTRFLCPWDFPGKGTGVGCHCLLWQAWQWQAIEKAL